MGANSKIEWTDHTWNPWIGCTKVSPACDHCYAERFGNRFGVEWGNHPRHRTSATNWAQPLKWDRQAKAAGVRKRVFCASLADWLDNQVPPIWQQELGVIIRETPNLDWLLLTKRPQNYERLAPWPVDNPPPNIWLGTTTENQEEADRRIPQILRWPAARHFISAEPLLGPLKISNYGTGQSISWVICGGEAGPGSRPMHPIWPRDLRDQCVSAGVSFFFKQHGHWALVPIEEHLPGRPRMVREGDAIVAYDGRWDILGPSLYSSLEAEGLPMRAVGKKLSGRLLDGVEHNESPASPDFRQHMDEAAIL